MLMAHMSNVHQELLKSVPGAIEGRDNPDNSVFGMVGVPPSIFVEWSAKFLIKNGTVGAGQIAPDQLVSAAAKQTMTLASSIIMSQLNQFQNAKPVDPAVKYGLMSGVKTEDYQKNRSSFSQYMQIQSKILASERKASQIILDNMKKSEDELKKKSKERRSKEVLFFRPDESGLSVIEARAKYYMGK